ncbi:MAG TPA: hypothetical protein VIJ86_05230 [Acidimicrobiales bacterium]
MRITRRHLQVSLAVLWLFDGALQCQPIMFSRFLARGILTPAGTSQPTAIAAPLHVVAELVSAHPALANGAFAVTQIVLGLALFTRRFSRIALAASIVWALSVWIMGEGLGGLATGATLLTGAPGAALLYAVIAILAWPNRDPQGDDRPSWLALPAWCALWLTGAVLQLVNGNNNAMSFTMMLRAAQSGSPGWIAQIDRQLVQMRLPGWIAAGVIGIDVLVGIWALVPGWTRQISIVIGLVLTLTGWLLFEGLGDLTSGRATDPNSGPLIVLLALAVLGALGPSEIGSVHQESQPRPKGSQEYAPRAPLSGASLNVRSPETAGV